MPNTPSSPASDSAAAAADLDSDPATAVPPTRKRGIDELVDSLSETGNRRLTKKLALKPYNNEGRWIPRGFSPFINVVIAFKIGMIYDANEAQEEPLAAKDHPRLKDISASALKENVAAYHFILSRVKGFKEVLDELADAPDVLDTITSAIADGLSGAKSDDSSSLKHAGLCYMHVNPRTDVHDPPFIVEGSKSGRGFSHRATARLLCPRKYLDRFDTEPGFQNELLDGRVAATATDWPTFLYQEDCVYDENDLENGLLRGYLVLRVWEHIYIGPSSALNKAAGNIGGSKATKAGNGRIHGLTRVSGRSIAYAAIQAWFFMSSLENFSSDAGRFRMETFFNVIVRLFEDDPTDEWCIDTLDWWNKQVFGTDMIDDAETPAANDESSDANRTMNQRAAKRARRAAALLNDSAAASSSPSPEVPSTSESSA